MILINNFSVSNDATKLYIDVETDTGFNITSAVLWTDETFKDYSQSVDVSSYLTGTTNREVITLPASVLGEETLSGIYFVEFESDSTIDDSDCTNCDNPLGVAMSLLCYKQCLLNKILEYSVCDPCACDKTECNIVNTFMFMEAMTISLQYGYYNDAIDNLNKLRRLCNMTVSSTGCSDCTDCGQLTTPMFKTGIGYGTIGGSLTIL